MNTKSIRRINGWATALIASTLLISCASTPSPSIAHEVNDVRVLVLGQDDYQAQVKRNNPAFQRVMIELQEAMHRKGFEVVDEDMIAADMDWSTVSGRDKADLMQIAKLANASEKARNRVRAIATFSIEATRRNLSYATKMYVTVRGQVYDAQSNRYLGSFELPTETVPAPGDCIQATCGSRVVGERARDIATSLGDVLARKLAYMVDEDSVHSHDEPKRGLRNHYTVTLRYFDSDEASQIIAVMSEEFPGYDRHEVIRSSSKLRKYEYVTKSPSRKLERWLTLLLVDMNLRPDREVELFVNDDEIRIEKVLGGSSSSSKRKYD